MDNKAQLSSQIKKAHEYLRQAAVAELMEVTRSAGVCRNSRIRVTTKGNRVTMSEDKFGVLAVAEVMKGKNSVYPKIIDIAPTSLLTEDEIFKLLTSPDEYFISAAKAVEIFSRNQPRLNETIRELAACDRPKITVTGDEVLGLLKKTNLHSVRMLTVLPTVLDDYSNKPNAELPVNYQNFLKDTPIGADKIIRALRLIWRIIDIEEEDLLTRTNCDNIATARTKLCLKDRLQESYKDYNATRKILGKMCITGAFYPVITMKAARTYSDIFFHPSYR